MARIHLVVGPVGAGKSTFVGQLCREHRAVPLLLDEWMTHLFRPESLDQGAGSSVMASVGLARV